MEFPADLRYTNEHEWARLEGDLVRIGITDYAQDALGDVVFVQLPEVGDEIAAGDTFGEVESTKSVSDLYAPVDGQVEEVNDALEQTPELVNSDPFGDGWLVAVRPKRLSDLDELMDADVYRSYVESNEE